MAIPRLSHLEALAEVVRLRAIVKTVAMLPEDDWDDECPLCGAGPMRSPIQHEQRCVIYRARVYLENEG